MPGCRHAWPAMVIMGVAVLALATALKAQQADMPLQPAWIMDAIAGFYVVLGLGLAGLDWRWPVLVGCMMAAHVVMALFMGWGYSAVEGQARTVYGALEHGLWEYMPGTALQVGFAGMLGAAVTGWMHGHGEPPDTEGAEEEPATLELPELSAESDPALAVSAACRVPGVAAGLLAGDGTWAAGDWTRDPEAALERLRLLGGRIGHGRATFSLDGPQLVLRSEDGRTAVLLVTSEIPAEAAHRLLRELWLVLSRRSSAAEKEESS